VTATTDRHDARRAAEAYERVLVPALFAGWAASLVDLAAPGAGARVLDVGCGTGVVARSAAPRVGGGGAVVGLDADPAMLAVARAASAGAAPPVRWCAGSALDLPFADGSFDVVLSQQALQFFADPGTALGEMRRVLGRGGRLAVSTWRGVQPGPCATALAVALARHLGAVAEERCAGGDLDDLRDLAVTAGLAEVLTTVLVERARARSVEALLEQAELMCSLGAALGRLPPGARTALIAELDAGLGPCAHDGGLAIPIEAGVVMASR
jgi:ubiquinone/menaquinone biosynthesis C-methylase UbiE